MKYLFTDRLGAHAIWGLLNHIADALVSRGDEVVFVRWDDGQQRGSLKSPDGVHLVDLRSRRRNILRQFIECSTRLSSVIDDFHPDIVHTNFTVPGALARRTAKRRGVPWVITTHHELYGSMSPHLRLLTRATERYVDQMVYVSQAVARSYGREAPVFEEDASPPRHVVIHNGIDVDAFAFALAADGDRVPGRILCTGRLVPIKGFDVLLNALPEIIARHSNAHIRLAGSGPDEARLRDLAVSLDIVDHVDFLGWVDRLRLLDEMRRCSAVAIPSKGEGFGLVAAEAMAAGVPIVASRIPIFEEVLGRDGECASLFTQGSVNHLAECICTAFADSVATQLRRDRALARVQQEFTAERMVSKYLAIYDQCQRSTSLASAKRFG